MMAQYHETLLANHVFYDFTECDDVYEVARWLQIPESLLSDYIEDAIVPQNVNIIDVVGRTLEHEWGENYLTFRKYYLFNKLNDDKKLWEIFNKRVWETISEDNK